MSTEEEEDAFFERLRNKRESNKKLYEENIKLKNENNKLTDDNIKLQNEIKKLKDEIIKLKELNKETEHEPETIVDGEIPKIEYEGKATEEQDDNGIMKIECVEVKAIERKDDKGDMKIGNVEGKTIETQEDKGIPKTEYVEGKTIETKDDNGKRCFYFNTGWSNNDDLFPKISHKDVEYYLLSSISGDNEHMQCYRQFIRGFNFYKGNYIHNIMKNSIDDESKF